MSYCSDIFSSTKQPITCSAVNSVHGLDSFQNGLTQITLHSDSQSVISCCTSWTGLQSCQYQIQLMSPPVFTVISLIDANYKFYINLSRLTTTLFLYVLFCVFRVCYDRETINSTWKVALSFKIIMTTSVTRPCFTTQTQTCKTKTDFLVSDRSYPKNDGLRPHHWQ